MEGQSPATVVPSPTLRGMGEEIPAGAPRARATAEAGCGPVTAGPRRDGQTARPAERAGAPASLSPSRAGDFLTCPLLYRFRVIDRLPEPPSPAAARGTLVHAVLEHLFDEPAAGRTPAGGALAARTGVGSPRGAGAGTGRPLRVGRRAGHVARRGRRHARQLFQAGGPPAPGARAPRTVREAVLASGLQLRGYIDRLDVAPSGDIRIVDYKTGTAPPEAFEARALFQMKFYALVLWRAEGAVPRLLQLMYLGSGEIVRYEAGRIRSARDRAQDRGAMAGHRARPGPATGAPGRAGSATGAPTRPSARRSVELPRRLPAERPPAWTRSPAWPGARASSPAT